MSQKSVRILEKWHYAALALCILQNLLNKPSSAAIYCKNPTSCKSSLIPVSHLVSASKNLVVSLLSFKDTFSLSRSFGTIIMLRIGCPFRSLNTFNVLSRQLVRKYYFYCSHCLMAHTKGLHKPSSQRPSSNAEKA